MSKQEEVVCVTGGSGCIGSWLVRLLLDRGYAVHATVKDLSYFLLLLPFLVHKMALGVFYIYSVAIFWPLKLLLHI